MIKKIGIKNFKSFGAYREIELGKLTVVAGENSSGKSSVYQSLFLILQSLERRVYYKGAVVPSLVVNGEFLKVGRKEELLNDPEDHDVFLMFEEDDERLELGFFYDKNSTHGEFILNSFSYASSQSSVKASMDVNNGEWNVEGKNIFSFVPYELQFRLRESIQTVLQPHEGEVEDGDIFSSLVKIKNIKNVKFENFMLDRFEIRDLDIVNCINERFHKYFADEKIVKELVSTKFKEKISLRTYLRQDAMRGLFGGGIIEIPPFRGSPQRVYMEGGYLNPLDSYNTSREDMVSRNYDFKRDEILKSSVEESLRYWVVDHLKIADGVTIEELLPDYATEIFLKYGNKSIAINNMGFGVSQILPILYRVISGRDVELFVVDEPEIHLHPRIQSLLADFFFHMSLCGKNFLIETHSEYLINRLIFLGVKYDKVEEVSKLLWVKRDDDGNANVEEIEYDDCGFLLNSPDGFLDERKRMAEELSEIRLKKLERK